MSTVFGISIIICTYNGEHRLQPTLEALIQLEVDFHWEIVVVNNASTDNTDYTVRKFFKTQGEKLNWKIIEEFIPGLVNARLKGVSEAKYDYVLFCDDDNWLFPNYLKTAAEILCKNSKIGVLGGKGIPVFESEKPKWFDQYNSSFAVGSQSAHVSDLNGKLDYLYGAGSIFKREILEEITSAGFNMALVGRKGESLISGDDVELCYLAQLKGYTLHYSERLMFYHWMDERRMNWDYCVRLKEGITRSSALLFSYKYFYKHKKSGVLAFIPVLTGELVKSVILYLKNLIYPSEEISYKDLSISILRARQQSYRDNYFRSISHFTQLKKHF